MPTDYGFTGQHSDSTSGLDYYNARYYDPATGQFSSADSVLQGGGFDILGLSRYAYVEGNPTSRTDPSGHCLLICAAIGAVAGAAIVYGAQVIGNLQKGESPGRALTDVSIKNIVIGAAAGAVIGGTLGVATPIALSLAAGAETTTVGAGAGGAAVAAAKISAKVLEKGGEDPEAAEATRAPGAAARLLFRGLREDEGTASGILPKTPRLDLDINAQIRNGTGGYVSLTKAAATAERFAGPGGRVAVIDRELIGDEVNLQDISTQDLAAQAGVLSTRLQYFAAIHNEVLAEPYINPEAVSTRI